ncbi:MAG TPA: hypothetical protein VM324_16075 [Egibacteraceae bacterium]|nr:hypothetical protein [Egibacteraceae bacterium]
MSGPGPPHREPPGRTPDPVTDLVDRARGDADAETRIRQRHLRHIDTESATVAGLLRDLLETGTGLTLHTTAGRSHQGSLHGLSSDCCVLRTAARTDIYLPLHAVTAVRPHPGVAHSDAAGDRRAPGDLRFAELLALLAEHRPQVVVVPAGHGQPLLGELRAVGTDVLTLRVEAATRAVVYVPVRAVTELAVADVSGWGS